MVKQQGKFFLPLVQPRSATPMRADIARGRRPIEYFSIVAAYFRGGHAERAAYFNNDIRVFVCRASRATEIIVPETRFDPFVPRIFAVSANRSMDSISRDYIMSSVSRTSEFLVSHKNSKILRYLRCRNSKFSILLK